MSRRWTRAEVDELERLITTTFLKAAEIGVRLNRSKNAIRHKAWSLGLLEDERPPGYVRPRGRWTPAEDDQIERQVVEQRRPLRTVELAGRTPSAVMNRAWLLGLVEERTS